LWAHGGGGRPVRCLSGGAGGPLFPGHYHGDGQRGCGQPSGRAGGAGRPFGAGQRLDGYEHHRPDHRPPGGRPAGYPGRGFSRCPRVRWGTGGPGRQPLHHGGRGGPGAGLGTAPVGLPGPYRDPHRRHRRRAGGQGLQSNDHGGRHPGLCRGYAPGPGLWPGSGGGTPGPGRWLGGQPGAGRNGGAHGSGRLRPGDRSPAAPQGFRHSAPGLP